MEEQERPAEFVEALAKGLSILECFDAAHDAMTLSEIARRTSVSPAAARRSLITLMSLGYVGQLNKRFYLSPKVMSLGSAFYFSARIDELLLPELRNIVEKFGDASSIATLEGTDVIYIAHYSVQRARRATAVVGARYPAHATSLGQVLLAGLCQKDLDRYFETVNLSPLTNKTITDPDILKQTLDDIRENNLATTVDQLDYGITALAVPIRGSNGGTVAALNSSGYTGMVTPDQLIKDRLPELQACASRIGLSISRFPIMESIIGGK